MVGKVPQRPSNRHTVYTAVMTVLLQYHFTYFANLQALLSQGPLLSFFKTVAMDDVYSAAKEVVRGANAIVNALNVEVSG